MKKLLKDPLFQILVVWVLFCLAIIAIDALAATTDRAQLYMRDVEILHTSSAGFGLDGRARPCVIYTEPVRFKTYNQEVCYLPRGTRIQALLQWRGDAWYLRGQWEVVG